LTVLIKLTDINSNRLYHSSLQLKYLTLESIQSNNLFYSGWLYYTIVIDQPCNITCVLHFFRLNLKFNDKRNNWHNKDNQDYYFDDLFNENKP
jgi:hypothetical protein